MNELLEQIQELYFLGGNLNEILETVKARNNQIQRNKKHRINYLFMQLFRKW